jgi:hypothetical protein
MSGAIPTVRGLMLIPLPIIWWNNQPISPSSATWIVAAMTWCIENTSSLGLKLVLRFDGDIIFDTTMDDQQWRPPMWSKRTARADAMVNRVVRCWLVFGLVWLESYFGQVPWYRALQGGTGAWFKKFWWVQEIDWWSMAIEPPFFHTDSYVIQPPFSAMHGDFHFRVEMPSPCQHGELLHAFEVPLCWSDGSIIFRRPPPALSRKCCWHVIDMSADTTLSQIYLFGAHTSNVATLWLDSWASHVSVVCDVTSSRTNRAQR